MNRYITLIAAIVVQVIVSFYTKSAISGVFVGLGAWIVLNFIFEV